MRKGNFKLSHTIGGVFIRQVHLLCRILYNTKFSRALYFRANPRDSRILSARENLVQVLSFRKLFTESKSDHY